ncbi:MAG: sigma-70 family RNA polymerase sigma factor [Chloroflexi bacterium]|nr:sigma-70 family RNA polymerase sigma factor [Chloroflexota bacterium]
MNDIEERLVTLAQAGDLEAFNAIVDRYQGRAYNLALRMLGEPSRAEDAIQEAFLSAYRNIRRFRGPKLHSWLLTIVANTCRDLLRSPHFRRTTSLEAMTEAAEPRWESREESPEEYAVRQELGREIQRGLSSLPEDQRLAIILVDIQGLAYEEAAAIMGASLGTVKSRLSRARGRMRDFLLRQGELLPSPYRQEK